MLTDPGTFMSRMLRDFDPWVEPRTWPLAEFRKSLGEFPWVPTLEMKERDHTLMVKLDLPGLKKEEVNVTVTERGLVIEGERTHEVEDKKNEWFTTERTYGRFHRLVPLPQGVKKEEVKATFKNGVLEVNVPLPALPVDTTHKVAITGEPETRRVEVAA
jgi:HSP20 family protein